MNSNDWKGVLGAVAPTIATILGGPLAGAAVGALSAKLLGKPDGTVDELAPLIASASPETLLALKRIDAELKTSLDNAGVRIDEIAAQDRDSARQRQVDLRDNTPTILAFVVLAIFASVLGTQGYIALASISVPPEAQRTLDITLGVLFAWVLAVKDFFFGSTSSNHRKDKIIADIAQQP